MKAKELGLTLDPQTGEVSESSTQGPAELSEPLKRAQLVFRYFSQGISEAKGNKVGYLISKLTDELLEEAADVPPEILEFYMRQSTAVLYWAATGEQIINLPMPHDFRNTIPAELRPPQLGEIEQ